VARPGGGNGSLSAGSGAHGDRNPCCFPGIKILAGSPGRDLAGTGHRGGYRRGGGLWSSYSKLVLPKNRCYFGERPANRSRPGGGEAKGQKKAGEKKKQQKKVFGAGKFGYGTISGAGCCLPGLLRPRFPKSATIRQIFFHGLPDPGPTISGGGGAQKSRGNTQNPSEEKAQSILGHDIPYRRGNQGGSAWRRENGSN